MGALLEQHSIIFTKQKFVPAGTWARSKIDSGGGDIMGFMALDYFLGTYSDFLSNSPKFKIHASPTPSIAWGLYLLHADALRNSWSLKAGQVRFVLQTKGSLISYHFGAFALKEACG